MSEDFGLRDYLDAKFGAVDEKFEAQNERLERMEDRQVRIETAGPRAGAFGAAGTFVGALAAHACGSPDACSTVKASGVVCTFGTSQRVTFHEQADIAAEVSALTAQFSAAHGQPSASDLAAIRVAAASGKNIHSAQAEAEAREAGRRHGESNRALYDSSPAVFGH